MWVLVADDDLLVARSTAAVLSHAGYRVEIAPDGRNAIERLTHERFDLFICDWLMPDVDGTAVVRALKASGKEIPAIILTSALHGPLPLQHAQRVGADGFLQKPASSQALLNAARSALAKRQAVRPAPGASAGGPPPGGVETMAARGAAPKPIAAGAPATTIPKTTPAVAPPFAAAPAPNVVSVTAAPTLAPPPPNGAPAPAPARASGAFAAAAAPARPAGTFAAPPAAGATAAAPAPNVASALAQAAEAKTKAAAADVRAAKDGADEPIALTERSPTWPPDGR